MLDIGPWTLKIQIVCSLLMTGLIWLVQLVHYPSFRFIHPDSFKEFHRYHSSRITPIVGPLMLLELGTAAVLAFTHRDSLAWWVNLLGVLLIWGCTAFLSIPLHSRLEKSMDPLAVAALVTTNWPRTLIWTVRSVWLLTFICFGTFK